MFSRHVIAALTGLLVLAPATTGADLAAQWSAEIEPILEEYCFDCHGDGIKKGGLAINRYPTIDSMQADRPTWLKLRNYLTHTLMPPADEAQPSGDKRAKLLNWIDAAVFPVDPDHPDPGHVVLRRLNRTEYQNTLRDLLDEDLQVAELLPPDDSGHGFDNIGGVLTVSPAHLDRYLEVARIALDQVIQPGPAPLPEQKFPGSKLAGPGRKDGGSHYLFTSGTAATKSKIATKGPYRIVISASGTPGGDEDPRMELLIDGKRLHAWPVKAGLGEEADHQFELTLPAGSHQFGIAFTNDYYNPKERDPKRRDRNLSIESLRIIGPLDGPSLPKNAGHRRIFGDQEPGGDTRAYARIVLDRFARRAFRRPPEKGEIDRYLTLVEQVAAAGEDIDTAIRLALEAMLVSPSFLFREEPPAGSGKEGDKQLISEYAIASRLSYFLWSSMPDDHLFDLAGKGQLRANLDREIDRMLDSPRSRALTENFLGQWLQLRDLPTMAPDRKTFPKFSRRLPQSMRRETELLFEHMLKENLPLRTLLDADFSFLDENLASHYGVKGVKGDKFRKVPLAGAPRRGLLGHGSFLLISSYPTRTSPVLRGKYVLENLLDTAPPPPPPDIPEFEPTKGDSSKLSLRQQFEQHRADPSCAACHALLDPIGFGLQNYDAVGRWRDRENKLPIDAAGTLSTGEKFVGPEQLRNILSGSRLGDFHRSVASKLLTYALGRGTEWFDKPAIDRIVSETETNDGRIRATIRSVIHSVPFQYRRASD